MKKNILTIIIVFIILNFSVIGVNAADIQYVEDKEFTEFEYVVWPDIFGVDGVVDASFTLNFLYLIGLKGGVTFSFGSSGYGTMPYISIVTAFKDFGLRMNNY